MSLLKNRVRHRWPEERHHMHVVAQILNTVPGLSDDQRFRICEEYVSSDTINEGRRILRSGGGQNFDLFLEAFIVSMKPSLPRVPLPAEQENSFFLVRWLSLGFRRLTGSG